MATPQKSFGTPPLPLFAVSQFILCAAAALSAYLVCDRPFTESLSYGALLLLGAVALSVLSSSFCAFLLLTRFRIDWFVGTVLGFFAIGICRFDFLLIPLFLLFVLPAPVLALCIRARRKRLFCVGALSALYLLLFAAIGVLVVLQRLGVFTLNDTLDLIYRAGDTVKQALMGLSAYNAETGQVTSWINEGLAEELVNSAIISLPGFALSGAFILAYINTFLTRLGLKKCGVLAPVYPDGFYPAPSLPTAILFAACLLISSLLGELLGIVVYATFYNLSNLLAVLFAIVGFDALAFRLKRRFSRGFSPILLLFLAVFLFGSIFSAGIAGAAQILLSILSFFVSILYPLLYFWGLISVFLGYYRHRKASLK